MIRLFTALSVPDDVVETLARRQIGLPGAKWRTADQLHITLTFYGEVDERRADDLSVELERAATRLVFLRRKCFACIKNMPLIAAGAWKC